jgi:hypothetical protein
VSNSGSCADDKLCSIPVGGMGQVHIHELESILDKANPAVGIYYYHYNRYSECLFRINLVLNFKIELDVQSNTVLQNIHG